MTCTVEVFVVGVVKQTFSLGLYFLKYWPLQRKDVVIYSSSVVQYVLVHNRIHARHQQLLLDWPFLWKKKNRGRKMRNLFMTCWQVVFQKPFRGQFSPLNKSLFIAPMDMAYRQEFIVWTLVKSSLKCICSIGHCS